MSGHTSNKDRRRLTIPVVDIFAGAGGLAEGFAAYRKRGGVRFDIRLSIESNAAACETLRLRSFFRRARGKARTDYYRCINGELSVDGLFGRHRSLAREIHENEVWETELGGADFDEEELHRRIEAAVGESSEWILVGGPPCQAYSTAGRARNSNRTDYDPNADGRHFLYREYLRIINRHWPAVFVMENVPGILSSRVGGRQRIIGKVLDDLCDPAAALGEERPAGSSRYTYRIRPLDPSVSPPAHQDIFGRKDYDKETDFLLRAEELGVPQMRQRVIFVGVRDDHGEHCPVMNSRATPQVPVKAVLKGLPRLRSGLARKGYDPEMGGRDAEDRKPWLEALISAVDSGWIRELDENGEKDLVAAITDVVKKLQRRGGVPTGRGGDAVPARGGQINYGELRRYPDLCAFIADERVRKVRNHWSRSHMASDLHRYLFVSVFGTVKGRSPKLQDFPKGLLPEHRNVSRALSHDNFADRFRVQLWDGPSTTIVSHMSKDGHAFVHPDPGQCRSLTVREAARLQTFPDNFLFCGGRGQQYIQVGNAVPPWLALQLAESVAETMRAVCTGSAGSTGKERRIA
jgi:DNA (cytosine-5)-methyltransferase 1